jgi:hypothetical protein
MIITVLTPFLYENTKAVAWVYDSSVYIHVQKVQEEPLKADDPIINIVGTGGVIRSDRIFAPAPSSIENTSLSTQDKGKQVDHAQQRQDSLLTNEVDEF